MKSPVSTSILLFSITFIITCLAFLYINNSNLNNAVADTNQRTETIQQTTQQDSDSFLLLDSDPIASPPTSRHPIDIDQYKSDETTQLVSPETETETPLQIQSSVLAIDYSNQLTESSQSVPEPIVHYEQPYVLPPLSSLPRRDKNTVWGSKDVDGPDRNDPYCFWRNGGLMCA